MLTNTRKLILITVLITFIDILVDSLADLSAL
jgi:hypothetical protein